MNQRLNLKPEMLNARRTLGQYYKRYRCRKKFLNMSPLDKEINQTIKYNLIKRKNASENENHMENLCQA